MLASRTVFVILTRDSCAPGRVVTEFVWQEEQQWIERCVPELGSWSIG